MARKTVRIEDLFKLKGLAGLRLSPDGMHAVVAVQSVNVEEQRNETALWLWRAEDDSFEQLTKGPADGSAAWLDNQTIVFDAGKRAGDEQEDRPYPRTRLYTMSLRGGEPLLRATLEGMVFEIEPSPDGSTLALAFGAMPEVPKAKKDVWKKCPPPMIANNVRYKMNGLGDLPPRLPSIYLLKVKKESWGKPRPLIDDPACWDGGIAWTPDGTKLVFHRMDPATKTTDVRAMVTDLKGHAKQLAVPVGPISGLVISPDGKRVAASANGDPKSGNYKPMALGICSIDPADTEYRVVLETDGQIGRQVVMTDACAGMSDFMKWTGDDTILAVHSIAGRCELLRVQPSTGASETIGETNGIIFPVDGAGETILYGYSACDTPIELHRRGRNKPLSRLNAKTQKLYDIRPKRWMVKTDTKMEVEAFLWATPKQLKASKAASVPLIVYVHGGPMVQTGDGFIHEYTWLVHEGYPVLTLNPRGSTGYGAEHGAGIAGNWGDRDVHDVLKVLESALKKHRQFDRKRVFILGGSYGGYMANMMVTRHPGVFRAAVSQRCVSNFISMCGTSDFSNAMLPIALGTDSIWSDPVRTWELSPISKIRDVRDPVLIIHSDNDLRCPAGQAEEFFIGLMDSGKTINEDVRFVLFKGETHELSRGGRPENRRVRLEEILGWVKKHDRARR